MLDIDFFADARAYLEKKNQETQQTEPKKPVTVEIVKPAPEPIEQEPENPFLFPELQDFFISEDISTLTYKNKTYAIPEYYNKEMIKNRDKKTLDMVFISLGLSY